MKENIVQPIEKAFLDLKRHLIRNQKYVISLTNSLKYSMTDLEEITFSVTYKRCAELISLLSPMDVNGENYTRVGKDYDGGYVMLDNFTKRKTEAAYSFGIAQDISWDETVANCGIDVFMYDHTIDHLPKHHPRFHFSKTGVTGRKYAANLKTLAELISENGHTECNELIMKMDIEGAEWDVFGNTPANVMDQFSQFVVEYHQLVPTGPSYQAIVKVLEKINQTHQSVHVHANLTGPPVSIRGLCLPSTLEVTYSRRNDIKDSLAPNTRQFPTEIDHPTFEGWPDLYLGSFSVPGVSPNT